MKQVALVTGGNRGIGLEVARQLARRDFQVFIGARDLHKGEEAVAQLKREGIHVQAVVLDVAHRASIQAAFSQIEKSAGRLDVLVNNAGIFLDREGNSVLSAELDSIRTTLETNTFGPLLCAQHAVPLMKKGKYGRIVNLSSGMGQLTEMEGAYVSYRISKTALNAVTRILADELADQGILVNSVCPGWVKTDMGGASAERSVEQGADTVIWAATLPPEGPTGSFFRDREPIAW